MTGFLKINRTAEAEELAKDHHCFMLLWQIAWRARRTNTFNVNNLEVGESFIGDYQNIGLTMQQYRTCKQKLENWNLASFKATSKGTIAKILDTRVFDINDEEGNNQITNEQQTGNKPVTTNKKEKKEKKEINISNLFLNEEFSTKKDFMPLVEEWLEYKKTKNQSYKSEKSVSIWIKELLKFSGEDLGIARKILDYSMGNNYNGIFPLKESGKVLEIAPKTSKYAKVIARSMR